MMIRHVHLIAIAITFMIGAFSCGFSAPYRTSGTPVSKQGVAISVAAERCFVNRSAEQYPTTVNDDEFNLGVSLQVSNGSNHVLVLSPDHFRVAGSIHGERTELQPIQSAALSLEPGATKIVALDFEQTGDLDCHHNLDLESNGAVAMDGNSIALDPIRFLPSP